VPTMNTSGQKKVLTPIFLSWSRPVTEEIDSFRWQFVRNVVTYLHDRLDMLPVTCGVNVETGDEPLRSIRRNLDRCDGLLAIALGKLYVEHGAIGRENTDHRTYDRETVDGMWVTSPFIHMEVAMAFQAGIPIRVIVERGVVTDGVLDDRVLGRQYKVEVDFAGDRTVAEILEDDHWREPMREWAEKVRQTRQRKGEVHRWYDP
jgi:hypothetical protein